MASFVLLGASGCDRGSTGRELDLSSRLDTVRNDSAFAEPATRQDSERSTESSDVANGRTRVVFIGTSLTAGYGLEPSELGYTDHIRALADSAGYLVQVVNAGVSGDTSAGGLRRVGWVLRTRVDVLVIELGANDGLRGQAPEALRQNLLEIIHRTRERHPEARVILAGMEAPSNMGEAYTSSFRQVFRDVALDTGVTLIPFLLEGVAGVEELNQRDRIHPSAEGHAHIARKIVWPVLEKILATLPARRP